MSNKIALPTMSIFGVATDPDIIAEKLFLYFLTSEYSQTVSFYGKISSLKYLLTQYATRPKELESEVRDSLIELYKKYFKTIDVDVEIVNENNNNDVVKKILIDITYESYDGVVSTINEELTTSGTSVTNLLNLIYR